MSDRHRISKVTTRAGDRGMTKLATGRTIAKHDPLMRVIGCVDELNSNLGLLEAWADPRVAEPIRDIQQSLFDMGAVFAMEGQYQAPVTDRLEAWIESINEQLPPLREFVMPRGGQAAAQAHVCRAVCRRAEQDLWQLTAGLAQPPESYQAAGRYLNRLSDLLFVMARHLGLAQEEQWQGPSRA